MNQKTVRLEKGLYLLRYESAGDPDAPPSIHLSVEEDSLGRVALVTEPDTIEPVLAEPGSCLVIRAADAGRLRVEMVPIRPGGSIAGTIKLDPLSRETSGERPAREPRDLDFSTLRVHAYLDGAGDVTAPMQEWIAGPLAPARIEGFAIEWPDRPKDAEIHYSARIGGSSPAITDLVRTGAFVGTRGRGLPLVGAMIRLARPGFTGYQLAVDAFFLGCPKSRVSGEQVVLAGPTGQEALVGLRFGVEKLNTMKDQAGQQRSGAVRRLRRQSRGEAVGEQ